MARIRTSRIACINCAAFIVVGVTAALMPPAEGTPRAVRAVCALAAYFAWTLVGRLGSFGRLGLFGGQSVADAPGKLQSKLHVVCGDKDLGSRKIYVVYIWCQRILLKGTWPVVCVV